LREKASASLWMGGSITPMIRTVCRCTFPHEQGPCRKARTVVVAVCIVQHTSKVPSRTNTVGALRLRLEQHLLQHHLQVGVQPRFLRSKACSRALSSHFRHASLFTPGTRCIGSPLSTLVGLRRSARCESVVEPQTTAGTARNLLAVSVASRPSVEEIEYAERAYTTHLRPEPVATLGTQDQHQKILSPRPASAMRLSVQPVCTFRALRLGMTRRKFNRPAMSGMNTSTWCPLLLSHLLPQRGHQAS
jgi:hypothetical protein